MATFPGWEIGVLKRINAPVTKANVAVLRQWATKEGGSAKYNPLNTTQPFSGASNYNSVGVKNYTNAQAGLDATAKTLLNGRYKNIVAQLRSGQPGWNEQVGAELNTWGTGSHAWAGFKASNVQAGAAPQQAAAPVQTGVQGMTPLDMDKVFKIDAANKILQQSMDLAQGHSDVTQFSGGLVDLAVQRKQIQAAMQTYGQSKPLTDAGGDLDHPQEAVPAVAQGASLGSAVLKSAMQQIGQPYVWGGESRKEGGFDCSGLIDWAMRQHGYKGPRITTYNAVKMGQEVPRNQLQPGDWIITHNGGHIVVYAGNGKVLAAPHTGTVVQYQPLSKFTIEHVRRVG